ncbi:MAG: GTP 3',8-cyclase MoaA [Gemmatales bacterium]|nr:GTP 3',8-cyclase MoaA [Gemmatales bacterium]MDW7995780.1 GTP 3',8-cyclase MoaA [Gemmatales bacterium]
MSHRIRLPDVSETLTSMPTSGPLVDTFGRIHTNLRISVTDRCNLRCTYCMPEDVVFLPRQELLTYEEITRFVRLLVPLGVTKLRLTGGEPLVRRDLDKLIAQLRQIPGIRDLSLTTNGILLAEQAECLYHAGLRRINISLDTLRPDVFRHLTRREGLERVLEGIRVARRLGFHPIKINAVSIRGVTEDEVIPLAQFAREHGLELRFIEYMPIGAGHWERSKVYFAEEILQQLQRTFGPLRPVLEGDGTTPAQEWEYPDGGRVGIIASVSRPFCHRCNRLRLTADGKLRYCLFALEETDIKSLLRGGASDDEIVLAVRQCVWAKWEGHQINTARFIKPTRTMHTIGG